MKVMIAGASGLLGGCMRLVFESEGFEVVAFGHSNLAESMQKLDITDRAEVMRVVGEGKFDWIVNCAADRDPESCLRDPLRAYKINAVAVEYLAEAANASGCKLCHISTDYVFDGQNPPYREEDMPNPINVYGRSKLAGEYAAKEAQSHLILRIPALYRVDLTDNGNVVTKFAQMLRGNATLTLDAECVRYYTLADDVAEAALFLLNNGACGVVHLTGEQKTTKAEFCRMIAGALGIETCEIIDGPTPPSGDRRPGDSHLSSDYYKSLGGSQFTSVDQALATF